MSDCILLHQHLPLGLHFFSFRLILFRSPYDYPLVILIASFFKNSGFSIEDGELSSAARQTLEAIQGRVEMELMAAPLLVSAAMADSSHLSIKGWLHSHFDLDLFGQTATETDSSSCCRRAQFPSVDE